MKMAVKKTPEKILQVLASKYNTDFKMRLKTNLLAYYDERESNNLVTKTNHFFNRFNLNFILNRYALTLALIIISVSFYILSNQFVNTKSVSDLSFTSEMTSQKAIPKLENNQIAQTEPKTPLSEDMGSEPKVITDSQSSFTFNQFLNDFSQEIIFYPNLNRYEPSDIEIEGNGFSSGNIQVYLGDQEIKDIVVVDDQHLVILVPENMQEGFFKLMLTRQIDSLAIEKIELKNSIQVIYSSSDYRSP